MKLTSHVPDSTKPSPQILDPGTMWNQHVVAWFQEGYNCNDLSAITQLPASVKPGCTVAVCTYKRAASLNRLLDSLMVQDCKPEQLVIVDASPNDETERSLLARKDSDRLAARLLYFRVDGPLKGITRQRNFALRWVTNELVAFFDDDVVLDPRCIAEMWKVHSSVGKGVVGVGAYIEQGERRLGWLTRQRLLFRVIPNCQPGRYHRSGISTGWRLANADDELIEGDWLPGGAVMWKTAIAREEGFCERFDGYAQGEDLDFSLRIRKYGKLVLACRARLQHFRHPNGRPDPYRQGYMLILNHLRIHRVAFPDGSWRNWCLFAYAWTLDTLFLTRHFLSPARISPTVQHIAGRAVAAFDIIARRRSLTEESSG